jgi:hypothetical protein
MKLLIGNTGLIGTTLKDSIKFDYEFNSKNLSELLDLNIDFSQADLYLCCLPATKWKVNEDPYTDLENIFNILSIISKKEYKNIILYSTIDVYTDAPLEVDESYDIKISSPNYGVNRFIFEKLISSTLKFNKLLILRLPALFGKYIKKNILFDLLNDNEINKINYNSTYQWYNLNNLANDTLNCLNLKENQILINLFSEPVETSDILKLFNINKSKVNSKSKNITYNFKTNSNPTRYVKNKKQILSEIEEFVSMYRFKKMKIAICLFGEPRDILDRIQDWKNFSSKFDVDFYLAFYSNNDIYHTIKTISSHLPVKSFFVSKNDLDYFDKLKYKAKHPIFIHTSDHKATFSRITSQCYIRQKAISQVELYDYNAIILCRSDVSNFGISNEDINNISKKKDLLIVNSDSHKHPGGGSGCTQCSIDNRCNLEFHANDICDYWCVGSPDVMSKWNTFYNELLDRYYDMQKTALNPQIPYEIECIENIENNEILIKLPTGNWNLIENNVHCYYPEKIMRSFFKDYKIVGATGDKKLWL